MKRKQLNRIFVKQSAEFDCGVACLKSIMRYYGSDAAIEKLRLHSGTAATGTTMLGLYQCAENFGFAADAGELDWKSLLELRKPAILHVRTDTGAEHYVCYFGVKPAYNGRAELHLIGDPAFGIIELSAEKLQMIWASRSALLLQPGESFVKGSVYRRRRHRWLINHILGDPQLLAGIILMSLIITLLGFAAALFSQKLIDNLLPQRNIPKISYGLILLLFVMGGRSVLSYMRSLFINKYAIRFQENLVGSMAENLAFKSVGFFMAFSSGEILSRFGEAGKLQKTVVYLSAIGFIDIVYLIFGVGYLSAISGTLGLTTVIFVPLIAALGMYYSRKLFNGNRELMTANGKFEQTIVDGLQSHAVYRENMREYLLLFKIKLKLQQLLGISDSLGKTAALFQFFGELLSSLLFLTIITLAAYEVINHGITIGELVVIFSIQASIVSALQRLMATALVLLEGHSASDKIFELNAAETQHCQPPVMPQDLSLDKLLVDSISFRFPGRRLLLRNLSFEISKGQTLAVTGKSGSGKSLLMQLLLGSLPLWQGTVKIALNGVILDVPVDRRGFTAHVPQQVYLFEGNLLENITIDQDISSWTRARKMCDILGFTPFFECLPEGLHTVVGPHQFQLSGGQRQLLGVARAIFRKPGLLLLDESTSAMDQEMTETVRTALEMIRPDMIILWVTHDPAIVSWCDLKLDL